MGRYCTGRSASFEYKYWFAAQHSELGEISENLPHVSRVFGDDRGEIIDFKEDFYDTVTVDDILNLFREVDIADEVNFRKIFQEIIINSDNRNYKANNPRYSRKEKEYVDMLEPFINEPDNQFESSVTARIALLIAIFLQKPVGTVYGEY